MTQRTKQCSLCGQAAGVLYRYCVAGDPWRFACEPCLLAVKVANPEGYRYGGTWKTEKRRKR